MNNLIEKRKIELSKIDDDLNSSTKSHITAGIEPVESEKHISKYNLFARVLRIDFFLQKKKPLID